jgi:antitoxin component YwqK of YwqJK toxin-antitoxin module
METVYKSCGNYIVTLTKLPDTITNENRDSVNDVNHAKHRANKLEVVSIVNKDNGSHLDEIKSSSYSHDHLMYYVGETVESDEYDTDINKVCSTGIHYFKTWETAYFWDKSITNGVFKQWSNSGIQVLESNYSSSKLHGSFQRWYEKTATTSLSATFNMGKFDGLYTRYHGNTNKFIEGNYSNGTKTGTWTKWDENGNVISVTNY